MMAPKIRHGVEESGKTKIVYIDGKPIEGGKGDTIENAKYSNWHGSNIDPDSLARHNRGLKRAGFVNNAHAKGIF